MEYIKEDEIIEVGILKVKKEYENKSTRSYWITTNFASFQDSSATGFPMVMEMQIFVKGGEIINRNITFREGVNMINASSHNYDSSEGFNESFVNIKYKNCLQIKEKKDEMILDNVKISEEEERIILSELFKNNGLNIDMDAFSKLFHKSLSELK